MVKASDIVIIGGVLGIIALAVVGGAKPPSGIKGQINTIQIIRCEG